MLGCHDFCGHYDWTFSWTRKNQGQQAVHELWEHAIGGQSQQHYTHAGRDKGLRGLYETWTATGEDEKCDWTFTLDETNNVLRWDMRQCPSKGFLLNNDLASDEDYCDHCMGWMIPLLDKLDVEVVVHQHNHAGQCWGEMARRGKPTRSPDKPFPDIRQDDRWQQGFLDRWEHNTKLPVLHDLPSLTDSCDVLTHWFTRYDKLLVIGRGETARQDLPHDTPSGHSSRTGVVVADPTYATGDVYQPSPAAVMMGDRPSQDTLRLLASRFNDTPRENRPLLMCPFLPRASWPHWETLGLPRPVPVLPLLFRQNIYTHQPHQPYPTTGLFMLMLAVALDKPVQAIGFDLYQPEDESALPATAPSYQGRRYAPIAPPHSLPVEMNLLQHLQQLAQHRLTLRGRATRLLQQTPAKH